MSSKRAKRRRACTRKIRYSTHEEALAARHDTNRRQYRGMMNIYRCKWCGGWHIGRAKRRYRK